MRARRRSNDVGHTVSPRDCAGIGLPFADVFVALNQLRRVQALCPIWLPDEVRQTQLNADQSPQYTVEFNPPGRLIPHVVLQLALGDPPGRRIACADIDGKEVEVYFERSQTPAGLHSRHYIAVLPGGAFQQGSYWISVHQDSQQSRRWNIELVLRIARSLRPPPVR